MEYTLLDSGYGRKLEKFGPYIIARPAAQALWIPSLAESEWKKASASFSREPENQWKKNPHFPASWNVALSQIQFKLALTDFGHLGIFPEQAPFWSWIHSTLKEYKDKNQKAQIQVLNLFAYSGGATLAAALAGAHVCHLDASKGMVFWARENAQLNGLGEAPIRWIVEDVSKFLKREIRRGRKYDALILDPPSFGRGAQGEVFKIEDDLPDILNDCRLLLSDNPLFVLFSCHSPGFTPVVMHHILSQTMQPLAVPGVIDAGEMVLEGNEKVYSLPSGVYARWARQL